MYLVIIRKQKKSNLTSQQLKRTVLRHATCDLSSCISLRILLALQLFRQVFTNYSTGLSENKSFNFFYGQMLFTFYILNSLSPQIQWYT